MQASENNDFIHQDILKRLLDPELRCNVRHLRERIRAKNRSNIPCPRFQRGQCRFGSFCTFSHNVLIATYIPPSNKEYNDYETYTLPNPIIRRKSETICSLYLKGKCKMGSYCYNTHPLTIPNPNSFTDFEKED